MNRLRARYDCPVELALELLGGKWKPVILARLKERPCRYGELRRLIPTLSDKVLTERLRDLEAQGLVERAPGEGGVLAVYRLTPRGETLRPVLQALYEWGGEVASELGVRVEPVGG
jgi:DNA-binding HxlR family transcriptional regulator